MSEKYEYENPRRLIGDSGAYFSIPESLILDSESNDKRITAFSYFSVRRGLDRKVLFSLNDLVKWTGRKPNRNPNGINDKFSQAVDKICKDGYVSFDGDVSNSSHVDALFDLDMVSDECDSGRFAIIYLDELSKIMSYKSVGKDAFMNNDVVLMVFAYLRMKIYRRINRLRIEETNIDNMNSHAHDVEHRRMVCPESYDCYYCDIAEQLGLTSRAVSKAVAILNEIGLIYSEALPRINKDGKWITDRTAFCNAYKREKTLLLAEGEEYYLSEIDRKKRKLKIR